jgi:hypothetical protein
MAFRSSIDGLPGGRVLAEQLTILELPADMIDDIANILESGGRASPGRGRGRSGGNVSPGSGTPTYNRIPAVASGPCRDLLLVFCGDADKSHERLREAVYHAGVQCPSTQRLIILTTQWNPKVWSKHVAALKGVAAEVIVLLAACGRVNRLTP